MPSASRSCLALVLALGLGACAAARGETSASTDQDMSPTDRLFVGAAAPYPADETLASKIDTLRSSQAARRAAAWQIAKRVLEPVAIDGGTRTLPRFQTWYAKEEVLPVFDHLLRGQTPADLAAHRLPTAPEVESAFSWLAGRATGTPAGDPDVVANRRADLDKNGDASLGGPERVLMSPETVAHLFENYTSILGCQVRFPAPNDPPPSATNFAPCVGTEFPVGSVIVKARWVPDTLPLDAWDTDAAALTTALTSGAWGTAPRSVTPDAKGIYTMTLASGVHMRLAALHIMSKELRDWAWVSLFWSDRPNTDFGADRPADLAGPFASYKMCTSDAFDEGDDGSSLASGDASLAAAVAATRAFGPRTWCSNPYLEDGPANAKTNCIGCHQHAGTGLDTASIITGNGAFPDGSRAQLRQNFPADYTFITTSGLDLATQLQEKVDALTSH